MHIRMDRTGCNSLESLRISLFAVQCCISCIQLLWCMQSPLLTSIRVAASEPATQRSWWRRLVLFWGILWNLWNPKAFFTVDLHPALSHHHLLWPWRNLGNQSYIFWIKNPFSIEFKGQTFGYKCRLVSIICQKDDNDFTFFHSESTGKQSGIF